MTLFKNLGLIQAMYAGTSPPGNIKILWFDENVNLHKFYNTITEEWQSISFVPDTPSLSSVLDEGNEADEDIIMTGEFAIKAFSGDGILKLKHGADGVVLLTAGSDETKSHLKLTKEGSAVLKAITQISFQAASIVMASTTTYSLDATTSIANLIGGTAGTLLNSNQFTVSKKLNIESDVINKALIAPIITPGTKDVDITGSSSVSISISSPDQIRSFTGYQEGKHLNLVNEGSSTVTIQNNAAVTPGKIFTKGGVSISVLSKEAISFRYSQVLEAWIHIT